MEAHRFKKSIYLLSTLVFSVTLFSACGGEDNTNGGSVGLVTTDLENSKVTAQAVEKIKISIRAKGDSAFGAPPVMAIYLNQKKIGSFNVSNKDFDNFDLSVKSLKKGDLIYVAFTNDSFDPETRHDRNLYIEQISVNGKIIRSTDSNVTFSFGIGNEIFKGIGTMSGCQDLLWNGALRFMIEEDILPPVTTGKWVKIGNETDELTVGQNQRVRYGSGTSWVEKTVSGSFWCVNDFFGRDPIYGTVKECQIFQVPQTPPTDNNPPPTDTNPPPNTQPGARPVGGLGMNMGTFNYWGTDFPTINQFKRAGGWFTATDSAFDTQEQNKLNLDADGWVKSLPSDADRNSQYRFVTAAMFLDDHGAHPSGTYTILYDGEGEITYSGPSNLKKGQGRDEVTLSSESPLMLQIRKTNPNNYIRNIRVIPPGGICNDRPLEVVNSSNQCTGSNFVSMEELSKKQLFYPKFLAGLQGVRAIRFMDWGETNTSTLASWSTRPTFSDAFWNKEYGVPLEAQVSLANAVGSDAWINIPTEANDNYASNMAKYIKENLNPNAQLILEYTNEPWNGQFRTYHSLAEHGKHLWGGNTSDGAQEYDLAMNYYATRSVQLCRIVKKEFGNQANRVKCIFNVISADTWAVENILMPCPKGVTTIGKECGKEIDAIAIAPYFGMYIGDPEFQAHLKRNWFNQPDGGLNLLFEEILAKDNQGRSVVPPLMRAGVSSFAPKGALAEARVRIHAYKTQIVDKYKLPLISYEGGQHMVNLGGDAEFEQKWTELFIRANRDPRMGQAYTQMMQDWIAEGGGLFTAYHYVGAYSKYGTWGSKETIFDADGQSPKWSAFMPYRNGSIKCWWNNCDR